MKNTCHIVPIENLLSLWFHSQLKNEYCVQPFPVFTPVSILCLGRIGEIIQLLAGLTVIADIIGRDGLENLGNFLETNLVPTGVGTPLYNAIGVSLLISAFLYFILASLVKNPPGIIILIGIILIILVGLSGHTGRFYQLFLTVLPHSLKQEIAVNR